MKDNEKKVSKAEEVKKEVHTEEEGVQLTEEDLAKVSGGVRPLDTPPPPNEIDGLRFN